MRRVVGDLSNTDRVLRGLDIGLTVSVWLSIFQDKQFLYHPTHFQLKIINHWRRSILTLCEANNPFFNSSSLRLWFCIIVLQYKISSGNHLYGLTFQNQMSRFYRPIHQWNLCHIFPLKCSPFLHEILGSPYLPFALFWERISLCCCVGTLVVGLNRFNTGRLTKLTRRNFLWNGRLVTWQSCRRWRRKWTACGTPF